VFVVATTPRGVAADAAPTGASGTSDDSALEEVIITGTSIKRINAETALPVQILKQEDIARTGATSVQELFHQISSAASLGSTVSASCPNPPPATSNPLLSSSMPWHSRDSSSMRPRA
jgi:hypothetical protein